MRGIEQYWYHRNLVSWLLVPLSMLFCAVSTVRRIMYRYGYIASIRQARPVVIVGNISVGGTGKTPLIIALCDLLKSKGYRPGVISRGYLSSVDTSSGRSVVLVKSDDPAEEVGDEPLLIVRATGCPVVVGQNRPAAAHKLITSSDCDIVLSDDGLQHYRLARDLELAVIDSKRPFGNGFCLPAGPLRETRGRLGSVDMIIRHLTGSDRTKVDEELESAFSLQFGEAVNLSTGESRDLAGFRGRELHAFAGIGNPQRFFDQLEDAGLEIIPHAFPDHHRFTASDLQLVGESEVLMTAKDAVKCEAFAEGNHWYVPVTAKLNKALQYQFLEHIKRICSSH